MEMESFQYIENTGWSVDRFPELDSPKTLVLIFASPIFKNHDEPIKELSHFYKQAKIMGCSTAGEIFGAKIYDNSLTVSVIRFKHTNLKLATAKIADAKDSFSAGATIAQILNEHELHSIFILSDGLNINGCELISGLNTKTDPGVVITGGLAGDGPNFKNTWVIAEGKILESYAVAIGFYGKHICVGHAFKGGWDIFGPERRITRSEGNILYELDNRPALSLYKEYLGERAAELPSSGLLYPLAIRNSADKKFTPLVRTILNVDEKNQSLIFAGDMPVGYYAQLMRANFDRLIQSASEASELANRFANKEKCEPVAPLLAIDISCVGRRLLLGERTEEETEATCDSLPYGATQIGFYSYGELSPSGVGSCELHNQTMTITTMFERDI
ncbi:MAG: FIST N-terminal domain-containing protein [Legionella sp.]|nr:FIST N-terminal domain-containing protein [Legionella sp.]